MAPPGPHVAPPLGLFESCIHVNSCACVEEES
jgi:hypothetical protein